MTGIFPQSIDFIVTDRCNLKCNVCWGSHMPEYEDSSIEKRLHMIDVFAEDGVERAVFTGGEPTLDKELYKLLRRAKEDSMDTLLFTNCMLMNKKKADQIMPYVDMISLSLDGPDEHSNSIARKPRHFRKVMYTLDLLRNYDAKVQVLTVVTQLNMYSLRRIGGVLADKCEGLDFQWKLNYYNRIGRSEKEYDFEADPFYIHGLKYLKAVSDARDYIGDRIDIHTTDYTHDYAYLFAFPDGSLYTTNHSEYVDLGNVFDTKSHNIPAYRKIDRNIAFRCGKERKVEPTALGRFFENLGVRFCETFFG